jgi:hypothetical protein
MTFNGGSPILDFDGNKLEEVTVGQVLSSTLLALKNDGVELTINQCWDLAKRLKTNESIELTEQEHELCLELVNVLPLKLAYSCLEALEK